MRKRRTHSCIQRTAVIFFVIPSTYRRIASFCVVLALPSSDSGQAGDHFREFTVDSQTDFHID